MGIAFGRPSLLLFGSTCPYLDTTRPNARVLYHRMDCSPCKRKPTCDGAFTCMKSIEVDEVLTAARELLGPAT
jgi:heptosyltransferase-1